LSASALIIDGSSTQACWMRYRDWLLSATVWLLYLYLVRVALIDLYSLGIGMVRWAFAGSLLPSAPEISRFFVTVWYYVIVATTNGMILIAWARYNQFRFGGQHRRGDGTAVSSADLAALYRVSAEDVAEWQNSHILMMQHDADGTLLSVRSRYVGQTTSIASEARDDVRANSQSTVNSGTD
jgi:biofilm PGA synthesis protein PgaD